MSEEHVIVLEADHATKARALLLWQDQGRPRLEAFVNGMGAGAQLLEHTIWAVIVGGTTLQGAEGANLDRWGALVGEIRGGLDDEQYRLFIALRIRVNTLFQNEDNVWQLIADAVAPYTVAAQEMLPNGKLFVVHSTDWLSEAVRAHLGALVRDFRPLGVNLPVVETVPTGFTIGFTSDGTEEDGSVVISEVDGEGDVIVRLIYTGDGRP